jgi:hypothetical protein
MVNGIEALYEKSERHGTGIESIIDVRIPVLQCTPIGDALNSRESPPCITEVLKINTRRGIVATQEVHFVAYGVG